MKKLILVRHAKSSWDQPLQDFDRPLTDEGIKKALKVATATASYIPSGATIWSSPAKRASSTALLFLEKWNQDTAKIQFLDGLYTFDSGKLEDIIRQCPDTVQNLILFGHNSAITDFVNKFGDIYIDDVPTAGLVSIIFDSGRWSTISKAKTDKILFPRDCQI